jgi:cobaltochelatase CobN
MHRLASTSGGWEPPTYSSTDIEHQPAPIAILTAADTEIQTLAAAIDLLPTDFPEVRVINLLHLQHQFAIDNYAETILAKARAIVLRLLGGSAYWQYGLEVVETLVSETGAKLIVLPGDDKPDPNLISHSNISITEVNKFWRYWMEGGSNNYVQMLRAIASDLLELDYPYTSPQPVPRMGWYEGGRQRAEGRGQRAEGRGLEAQGRGLEDDNFYLKPAANSQLPTPNSPLPKVGIVFYRAHYLAGNLAVIDALCDALAGVNLQPVPIFVSSLQDVEIQQELCRLAREQEWQLLLNTTSFALAKLTTETPQLALWEKLDLPVLQVILSSSTEAQWADSWQGLQPRDLAMNVALPEVDGRIITRAVSFKAVQSRHPRLLTAVVQYAPEASRIEFVAELARRWVKLRSSPTRDRKIALILANYPTRDGRLANGVGLDTPASCIAILEALRGAGYCLDNIPATGEELIKLLTQGVTNDLEGFALRPSYQSVSVEEYLTYFETLPQAVKQGIIDRWGEPKSDIAIPGIQLGHIFIGIQPARGYDRDPRLNYHAPDLEPTHEYVGFYYWVNKCFAAHAIVHIGKHGNLEWLPGKSIALSADCYPEAVLGAMPHFYPFIVNDPGEGSQAKRRAQAVIIDHLTPPMTRAELYGGLQKLEGLIDEYYEAQSLDPSRLKVISDRLTELIKIEYLDRDLGIERKELTSNSIADILGTADGYLCELKEAQIRDGLHIFGKCPTGRQLRDLIISIARYPGINRLGLTRAIAQDWQLDFDPLTVDLGQPWNPINSQLPTTPVRTDFGLDLSSSIEIKPINPPLQLSTPNSFHTAGDVVNAIENYAAQLIDNLLTNSPIAPLPHTEIELAWIRDRLLPNLYQTHQEITNLLNGLDGKYIPSGASGAPTRGRPEVLPTGRNFYAVDIRAIPTETAWDIGRKAADLLIETYTQEHGEYPQTLGLSVWGTSTMRTGGDDIAQALALIGVQPVWDGLSRRVVDFEILPLSILGRPRIDVTLRISGFFRDAFPNLIDLFDSAVRAVANLNEPPDQNPIAVKVKLETEIWQSQGLELEQAQTRASYRIFGSKPSAYGAGLQGLIESQNWDDEQDLARAYINWSSYAYSRHSEGVSAPEAFNYRLQQMQIVLQNQDNREHDLLDSDDYYQFHGGLTAAVKTISGSSPQVYFGDNSRTMNPKVRKLTEEINRVYRSRVINPKWIAGAMRHGYKGAFEMAATLDYLFAYDATTNCVADFMYRGIADAYIFDSQVEKFIKQNNPWALRDMAERLLEAQQRGLWQGVEQGIIDRLRAIVHEAEGVIEMESINNS